VWWVRCAAVEVCGDGVWWLVSEVCCGQGVLCWSVWWARYTVVEVCCGWGDWWVRCAVVKVCCVRGVLCPTPTVIKLEMKCAAETWCMQVANRHDIRASDGMELVRPYRQRLFLLSAAVGSFQLLLRASASSSILSRHGTLAILLHQRSGLQYSKRSIDFYRQPVSSEPLRQWFNGC